MTDDVGLMLDHEQFFQAIHIRGVQISVASLIYDSAFIVHERGRTSLGASNGQPIIVMPVSLKRLDSS